MNNFRWCRKKTSKPEKGGGGGGNHFDKIQKAQYKNLKNV